MAKYAIGQAYKDLPPWAKGVIFVGGAVALGVIIMSIRRSIKKKEESKVAQINDDWNKKGIKFTI